jgi:hypothetical protein
MSSKRHRCQWCKGQNTLKRTIQGTFISDQDHLAESQDHCLVRGVEYVMPPHSKTVARRYNNDREFTLFDMHCLSSSIHFESGYFLGCLTCRSATVYCQQENCESVPCVPQLAGRTFLCEEGKCPIQILDLKTPDQTPMFQYQYGKKVVSLLSAKGLRKLLELPADFLPNDLFSIVSQDYLGLKFYYSFEWLNDTSAWKCPQCNAGYIYVPEYIDTQGLNQIIAQK